MQPTSPSRWRVELLTRTPMKLAMQAYNPDRCTSAVDALDDVLDPLSSVPDTVPRFGLVDMSVVDHQSGTNCGIAVPEPAPEPTKLEYWAPRVTILGCCALYGTNFVFGKLLAGSFDPSVVSGLRFSLAALALSPYLRQFDRALLGPVLSCGAATSVAYIGQAFALQSISAGKTGFMCSLSVIICPLLEAIFDGVRVTPVFMAAIALSLTGVGTLELTGGVAPSWGDAYAIAQPLGFGYAYWRMSKIMRKSPTQTLPVTAAMMATIGAISLAWFFGTAAAQGRVTSAVPDVMAQLDVASIASIFYLGIVTTAMTSVGETKALASVTAGEASILLTTEPVWAAFFGWLVMGETLGGAQMLGGSCIIAACLLNLVDADRL